MFLSLFMRSRSAGLSITGLRAAMAAGLTRARSAQLCQNALTRRLRPVLLRDARVFASKALIHSYCRISMRIPAAPSAVAQARCPGRIVSLVPFTSTSIASRLPGAPRHSTRSGRPARQPA